MPCDGQTCEDDLLKTDAEVASKVVPGLLDVMRSLAVIPIATVILRRDLQHMHHERDEPFRVFAAGVLGKGETCALKARLCQ